MTDDEIRKFATWMIQEAVWDAAGDYVGLFEGYETFSVLSHGEEQELSEEDVDRIRDTMYHAKLSVTWDD